MKLIRITGKAGSGKTTFSNMLAVYPNIEVIHIDDILNKIKLKYFRLLMKKNHNGKKTKVDSKLKLLLYKNKLLFTLFMKFRAKLIKKPLTLEIERLKKNNAKYIIIDDIFLQHQSCYKDLSSIILMKRPYTARKNSLMERDKISKEEVVSYDMAHFSGNYKELTHNNKTIEITNKGDENDLLDLSKHFYEKHLQKKSQNMKDKYKVTNSSDVIYPKKTPCMSIQAKLENDERN